jgi:hypothetical protein
MLYIFIILFLLFFIINMLLKKYEYFNLNNIETVSLKEYSKIMVNNNNNKLYKISLSNNMPIYTDDCFLKCSHEDCIKFENRKKLLDKCLKCNNEKNKCFKKSIIGGNCDNCNIKNIEDKEDCYKIHNYGCPSPDNINNLSINRGVRPYYLEIPDNNVNSPFDKKCVFCWDLLDNL